jgi:hypothetical protein
MWLDFRSAGVVEYMTTKEEFTKAYRICRTWITASCLGLTALWCFIFFGIGMRFKEWFNAHGYGAALWVVFTLALFLTGCGLAARFFYKRHGMICPSCGGWIGTQQWMVKTGRCPRCQAAMFHDA